MKAKLPLFRFGILALNYVVSAVNSNSVVSSVVMETLGLRSMIGRLPNDPNANWVGLSASLVSAPSGGYKCSESNCIISALV